MTHVRTVRVAAFLACMLPGFFSGFPAWGAYPEKPIRLIVPSPPGGGNDIMARLASQKLTEAWGRQVLVDNRPGAGGVIAFEMAARAEPNGYTLLAGKHQPDGAPGYDEGELRSHQGLHARFADGDVDEHSPRCILPCR